MKLNVCRIKESQKRSRLHFENTIDAENNRTATVNTTSQVYKLFIGYFDHKRVLYLTRIHVFLG